MIKNDIKLIPFDTLTERIMEIYEQTWPERLEIKQRAVARINSKRVKEFAKSITKYYDPEEGSDGIEEEAYETLSLADPDKVELEDYEKTEILNNIRDETVPSFIQGYDIGLKYTWLLPQALAYIGNNWKLVKNEEGLYDPKATYRANINDDSPWDRGLYLVLMWSRSDLIKGKDVRLYKEGRYNNLVPLILSAFKEYQQIKYSEWARDGISYLVDKDLAEAMLSEVPEVPINDLLLIRKAGLTTKTGIKSGTVKDPRTTAMLYGLNEYPLAQQYGVDQLPKYAKVMLGQIWCAHPENRTHHMILDPNNWDNMPEPLIDATALTPARKTVFQKKPTINSVPW